MADQADRTFGLTMADALARFEGEGYTSQFGAVEGDLVRCYSCHVDHEPETIDVDEILRVEGVSDPDDMVAVAALTCPACGCRGTASLKYGAESTVEESEVLRRLEDRRKGHEH